MIQLFADFKMISWIKLYASIFLILMFKVTSFRKSKLMQMPSSMKISCNFHLERVSHRCFSISTVLLAASPTTLPIISTNITFSLTGIRKDCGIWNNQRKKISDKQENAMKRNLVVPGEYCSAFYLSESRRITIEDACLKIGMSFDQAMSLRKQLLVGEIDDNRYTFLRHLETLHVI
jgi:hypothetical protein